MIDLHCHILPAIDDGPSTMEGSVAMARMAASHGIRQIVATPHFKPGIFTLPTAEEISEAARELNERVLGKGFDLKILTAAEVRITPDTLSYLEEFSFLTYNQNGRYFLAEFPMRSLPDGYEDIVAALLKEGYVPVIAHPERNFFFQKNPYSLLRLVEKGGILQLTAESLCGEAGVEAQKLSEFLLKAGAAVVIATDAHSITSRPPDFSEALKAAGEIVGEARALLMVTMIPEAIIKGEDLPEF